MKNSKRKKHAKHRAMFTDKGKGANHPIQTIRKIHVGNFLLIMTHRKATKWAPEVVEQYAVELLDENYHGPRFQTSARGALDLANRKFAEFFKVAIKNIGADLYSDHLGL